MHRSAPAIMSLLTEIRLENPGIRFGIIVFPFVFQFVYWGAHFNPRTSNHSEE